MSIALVQTPGGMLTLDDAPFETEASAVDPTSPLPRLSYAAAHVVFEDEYVQTNHSVDAPGTACTLAAAINWADTMKLRTTIGATGMGIAESMDTAQRFSLGWDAAQELIRRTGALNLPGGFCAGAGRDQFSGVLSTNELIAAVSEQVHFIVEHGGIPIVLPMESLATTNCDADEYVRVYEAIALEAPTNSPLFVHWLGPMFLASLQGYFPDDSFLRIMRSNPETFRGAKLSMLNAPLEERLRADLLQRDQIMLTGDDFHFGGLIRGDNAPLRTTKIGGRDVSIGHFSHPLLGIFDAIAPSAALAMRLLDKGDTEGYNRIIEPCERLGQTIFESPTRFYKTGLAFLSWINGAQSNAMLANHEERNRDHAHLLNVVEHANAAGAIVDAPLAAERLEAWLRAT
jgi:hypothetical protein